MEYRNLGKSGLKVSELSLGSWITFGGSLDVQGVRQCMKTAYDHGVNFFDNAEAYANGASEHLMGEALKEYRRQDLVISTKIFWGGKGVNDNGLSWKHLVEGTKRSLQRMGLDYLDLIYCHRPDHLTPIEETVRAIDVLIKQGLVFYWGTSEWKASEIEAAYEIAYGINATPPTMEQPEYNLFKRERVESEYAPIYQKYGLGITSWSPLDSGILTGKYAHGIPDHSRLDQHKELRSRLTEKKLAMIKNLEDIARQLGCTLSQLAIAWCLKNENVSSVITGASHPQQIEENMQAIHVKHQITDEIKALIETMCEFS